MGRPSDFKPEYVQTAAALCEAGATDEEVAEEFGCSVRTLYRWKSQYPDFCQALKVGKSFADARVEHSFYHRAVGFRYKEQQAIKVKVGDGIEKIEIVEVERTVPPDASAGLAWLKNRAGWNDRQELTGADGKDLLPALPPTELAREIAFMLAKAAQEQK